MAVVWKKVQYVDTPVPEVVIADARDGLSLTTAECTNTFIVNSGQYVGSIHIHLPNIGPGLYTMVQMTEAGHGWKIYAHLAGTDRIYFDGTLITANWGVGITSSIVGNFLTIFSFRSSAAPGYSWIFETGRGLWTASV